MKLKVFALIVSIMMSNTATAGYNDNIVGEVKDILVYTNGQIIFSLVNQPTHPTCNPGYFAIDNALSEVVINRMFSRLLSAHASKTPVNIGFDNAGDCANTYIRVHRVG